VDAEDNLRRAWCPFMNAECDGGGNRYQSAIDIKNNPSLRKRIPNKDTVQCGVRSLQTHEGEQPWIVCPRRLFALKRESVSFHQNYVREQLSTLANLNDGGTYYVWSEVKIKTEATTEGDEAKLLDYTFDYVLSCVESRRVSDISILLELPENIIINTAQNNGYTLASRNSENWIENFPTYPFIIIEVMTSSTSGGNKRNRTQISMACEDAILHQERHNAPGINYRQVWARMVSQLIVKSQVAIAWGGKTI